MIRFSLKLEFIRIHFLAIRVLALFRFFFFFFPIFSIQTLVVSLYVEIIHFTSFHCSVVLFMFAPLTKSRLNIPTGIK